MQSGAKRKSGAAPRRSVLVTGAAGFIGSHLAERCLSHGWQVTGLDSFTDYYPETLKRGNLAGLEGEPNFEFVEADLLDPGLDLRKLLANVSVVFHLAAQPGVRVSWEQFGRYTDLNLNATQRLLDCAVELPVERIVLASSSSVYGDAETFPTREDVTPQPVSPYGVTKVATELLARTYWRSFRVPTVCLRYFTVFGPRQRPDMAFNRLIACALLDEPFPVFGDGRQTRDFTFVGDTVEGTIAAAERGTPGSVYNLGGGSSRSLNDVLDTLGELLGKPIRRVSHARQLGDARNTGADISRAGEELGYQPAVAFDAGLRAQLEWQRSSVLAPESPR